MKERVDWGLGHLVQIFAVTSLYMYCYDFSLKHCCGASVTDAEVVPLDSFGA